MYSDEEELELLRQYEEKDLFASPGGGHSSDEIDSDLEERIMTAVQFGSATKRKENATNKTSEPASPAEKEKDDSPSPIPSPKSNKKRSTKAKVVYAPIEDYDSKKKAANVSSANDLFEINSDEEEGHSHIRYASTDEESDAESESDSDEPEETEQQQEDNGPRVTGYINLDEDFNPDSRDADEEDPEHESTVQDLIDFHTAQSRGRPRYQNKPIRICFNCYGAGHERNACPKCRECGGPKHPNERCVGMFYCSRCKLRGHVAADCDNKRGPQSCTICHMSYHSAENCPSLLHEYEGEVNGVVNPPRYCYYCARQGHYGDECPDLPQRLTTMPSAFSVLSLDKGSRFEPRKRNTKSKNNNSNNNNNSNRSSYRQHQRFDRDDRNDRNDRNDRHGSRHESRNDRYEPSQSSKRYKPNPYSRNNGTGNSNWKEIQRDSLPKPSRSGKLDDPRPSSSGYYKF